MELTMAGKVLDMQVTKGEKFVRVIVQGKGRYNDVLMVSTGQAMAHGLTVGGEFAGLVVGPALDRDREGAPTGGVVYFGRDHAKTDTGKKAG